MCLLHLIQAINRWIPDPQSKSSRQTSRQWGLGLSLCCEWKWSRNGEWKNLLYWLSRWANQVGPLSHHKFAQMRIHGGGSLVVMPMAFSGELLITHCLMYFLVDPNHASFGPSPGACSHNLSKSNTKLMLNKWET